MNLLSQGIDMMIYIVHMYILYMYVYVKYIQIHGVL